MNPFSQRLRDLARGDAQSLTDIDRLSLADEQMLLESADRLDEQETAVAQAVAFAQYVEDHAKGSMVEAARKFLSLPFSQQIAARLNRVDELELELAAVTEERDAIIASARIRDTNAGWRPIETRPEGISESYIVGDAVRGLVAPWVRGVIHSNAGTAWDWHYGEAVTHWMPLPAPPTTEPER